MFCRCYFSHCRVTYLSVVYMISFRVNWLLETNLLFILYRKHLSFFSAKALTKISIDMGFSQYDTFIIQLVSHIYGVCMCV